MFTEVFSVFLVAQVVKNPHAMWETGVQFLGQEDPLEKEMAAHSSILPGESHGQRSLVGYSPLGCRSQTRLSDSTTTTTKAISVSTEINSGTCD